MATRRTHCLHALLAGIAALALIPGCEEKPAPPTSQQPGAPASVTATRVTVLAAASLADTFREIGAAYEAANPGSQVVFSFAGSNQLRTQLEHGGPGDVFASADRAQMNAAVASKVVDGASVRVLARNRLALIVPKENRAAIKSLNDLARGGLKIVIADTAVPAGNYTRLMLDKAAADKDFGPAFVAACVANIASREENVAAVVTKVVLNEADAGIAYASDAAGQNASRLTMLPIPESIGQQAEYVIAITTRAADAAAARTFLSYLRTREALTLLQKRGFTLPELLTP